MALLASGGLSGGNAAATPPARDPDRYVGSTQPGTVNANPGGYVNPTGTFGSPWDQSGSFNTQATILGTLYNNLYGPGAKDPRDLLRALAGGQYQEQRDQNQIAWLQNQKNALPMQRAIDQGRYTDTRNNLTTLAGLLGGELNLRNQGFNNDWYRNDLDYIKRKDQFDSQTIDAGAFNASGFNRDRNYMAQDLGANRNEINVNRGLADNTFRQNYLNQITQPGSSNEWGWKQNQLDAGMKNNSLESDIRDKFLQLLSDKLGTAAAKDKWDERGVQDFDISALVSTLPPDMQALLNGLMAQQGG